MYRPGYAWRGYFVLNRKASGAAFHDGNPEAGYPRVRSAPMGWNNVVDFIQDGFETLAKRAQLDPGQMIRMEVNFVGNGPFSLDLGCWFWIDWHKIS